MANALTQEIKNPEFPALVASLDPLDADSSVRSIREMNAGADVMALAGALSQLVPPVERVIHFTQAECTAALRDLGLFLGSIKRHGVEPLSIVPQVERPLLIMGQMMDMVPRDTFYHYGPCNPIGYRQRMYIEDEREGVLIQSLRLGVPAVEGAAATLEDMLKIPPEDKAFAELGQQVIRHLEGLVQAIDLVKKHVPPEFFARIIRPYFEDVELGGRRYLGPAAAQMPLYLVDRILWSCDCADKDYLGFQTDTVQYIPPRWRKLFYSMQNQPSVCTNVLTALRAEPGKMSEILQSSAQALCAIFDVLITFRGRHLPLVRGAYHKDVRLYELGSGGASVDLVEHILRLTRQYDAIISQNRSKPLVASQKLIEGSK